MIDFDRRMAKENKQEKCLLALLETSSIREASAKSGIGEATFYRYLNDKEFLSEYRSARRQTVESAITQIQKATAEAVETLKRNLHCENAAVEVRCAQIILETAVKGVELIDVIERLEVLENAVKTETKKD